MNQVDFGQLYNTPLDGQVYAEPLVLTNVTISAGPNTIGTPGTYNSVVFVATEHDSLYAINAANGAILWQRTFLDTTNPNDHLPGASSVITIANGGSNISPEIGITSTPVIDPSTNIIYALTNTKEYVGGVAYIVQRLHAISLSDGTDAASAYVIGITTGQGNINSTPIYVNGTGDGNVNGVVQFNALRENNRPALSLVNGEVYAEWASYGDTDPYHGWVVRWDVSNVRTQGILLSGVLCTDPNGGEAGIWQGGGGLTFDPDESFNGQPAFYFETGNGDPRGGPPPLDANGFPSDDNYYESLVKVESDPTTTAADPNSNGWGMKIVDYFTPYNVNALDLADEDFGSGAPLVLPDAAGIPGHPHLIVAAGKEGKIYLIDRDDMGEFHVNDDDVLNSVYNPSTGITTPPVLINGSASTPAYYHGVLYWVGAFSGNAFSYVVAPNPAPEPPAVPVATLEPTSEANNGQFGFGYVPGSVMISANGDENPADAVVWIVDRAKDELHAYSALSLNDELWNSSAGSIATVKFAVPTVANGQVFVGTLDSLQVFGLTGEITPVQAPIAPANLSARPLSGSAVELSWTDGTVSPNFATSYAIQVSTDGVNFAPVASASQESTNATVTGLAQNTTYYFQVVGSNSAGSSGPSNIASAQTTNQTGQTPTAPQGLGATPASGSEVYLTWTNTATNETGFVLTRATDPLFTQNVVTETVASAPYYYTDGAAGVSPGNTYYYKLQATNSAGLSSESNTASVNIPNVPPAATGALAVQSGNSVELSWTDNAGPFALGYQISRSVDGGPYVIYTDRPETSDAPPTTQIFTDTNAPIGHTYRYEIVAENVSGFSAAAYATASTLGLATLALDNEGNLAFTVSPGAQDQLTWQLAGGIYTLADPAVIITVTGAGAGFVTGAGTSAVSMPAANVSAVTLDTSDNTDTIRIISDAVPITITADSGGGDPTINLGDPTLNEIMGGTITNASNGNFTISGSGTTTITGNLISGGTGSVFLAGTGTIDIVGNINLGPAGNLIDSGSGEDTISGTISGTETSGFARLEGLYGAYYNIPAAQDLIQPASPGNSAWLGNQTPAATARLIGPIDFPDIADNGFADSVGDPAYYNLGAGDNNNVEGRWYGEIMIPGTGTAPVPVNFATTSDDGSMVYIDGNTVVSNNNFQGATRATGLVYLTPGLHAIDVEYYQGYSGASMDLQWDLTGGLNFVDIPIADFSTIQTVNGLKMTGVGTLTLSATNTYSGSTTISAGTLVVTANSAMGPATATGIVVDTGAALALGGGVNYTTAEPITVSGSGPYGKGAIENISGTNTFAGPITLTGPATIGTDAGSLTLGGNISSQSSTLTVVGGGTTTINGNITCTGLGGGVTLADSGSVSIAGNINLGPAGNLTDTSSGQDTITGVISGTALSGDVSELFGTYFNLTAAQDLIQPAAASNSAWLGNQTPTVTASLVGPIDFPDIADNGFADNVGDPAYYNLGAGNNNNVEARWYGNIMIPGTGTAPVPINFATTSDDGSVLYIDGNLAVDNNNFQPATRVTGLVDLTPGLHTIDVEYYQGTLGASMDLQWDPTGGTNFVDIPISALVVPVNGLTKTGGGTLTLSNTNTYLGSTTISAGTLVVTANGAMGPATATGVVVNAGAALALSGGVNYTIAEPITVSGSGPYGKGAIENISGTNTLYSPVTLTGPATIDTYAGSLTLGGNISAQSSTLTVVGGGTTTINGNITCAGSSGGVTLADSGGVRIAGNLNLGPLGNLTDSSSGQDTITGVISGASGSGFAQGLYGTYFNLPATQDLIQPAAASNPAWLGNQTPAVTANLIGPLDFPNIAANGFADSVGDPAYYNLGNGNNNVEARWYGNIMIPGTGTTPVPVDFATTSDDGSMVYIDGNTVVSNNYFQPATRVTGLVDLTPGLHTIDVEYYQGTLGASMDLQWDPTGGTNFVDIPNTDFSTSQAVNTLTMTGTGTLTLSATNTYSGSTTISAGTVVVTANGAMGPATATGVVVNTGAALAFTGGVNYTTAEPITVSGSGPYGKGALENISGTNTFAGPITLTGPATIGTDAGRLTLGGNISAQSSTLTVVGGGTTAINGNITCTGAGSGGGLALADSGSVSIAGNINLGPAGNLTDSSSGQDTITGVISGSGVSGFAQGLYGTYFNLPAAQNLIQPAAASNTAWLGNQTPVVTARLIGPLDFPNIAANGFADNVGDPAYFNLGNGNNNNVEARWYGNIMIPGTGTAPVPIDFATRSDDGSMVYIDGDTVVSNNYVQGATRRTGLVYLSPGLHTIDVEYYQGILDASMDLQWDPTGGNNFVDIPNSDFSTSQAVNTLTMTGTGTLTLSATNTYSGSTTISAGTLVVTANGAMGPATATGVVVNTGAALALTGGVNYTTAEPITVSGSGPYGKGAIENISGTNTFAGPITLTGPATIGTDAGSLTLGGNISAQSSTLTVVGGGTTTINGNITCAGSSGGVTLADSGSVSIAGNINLGPLGNLTDSSSGQDTITGVISGSGVSGFAQGLSGTYFNLPATQNLIQPAVPSNPAWLGNQTPVVTARLIGPLDFPNIAANGFADNVGDPAYFNLGNGNNNNVEARWYGNIMIPGTGTAPVPIDFATRSDDGSMVYIDGDTVVSNNYVQGATRRTGLVYLSPGLHTIDVEYYQGILDASMDLQWDPTGGNNFVDIPNSDFSTSQAVNTLTMTGTGTLTLSNIDTYAGPTTVNSGNLVVNGRLLGAVTVNAGATLGVGAGGAPGTFTAGSLSLATGSTFNEVLGGTTAGTQFSQTIIAAGGTLALNGTTLNLSFLNGFQPTFGQQFTIIANQGGGSVIGTFNQGSTFTVGTTTFGINYAGGAGHDVVLTVVANNVTSQLRVTQSGLIYNRATQLFGGTVTLTNIGTTNITGALAVEVTGLPAGVTLANASGTAPDGNPYITVNLTNGVLAPNQSITMTVQFRNPSILTFAYGTLIFEENPTS